MVLLLQTKETLILFSPNMRTCLLLLMLLLVSTFGFSQRVNVNFFLGTSNYMGDMQANFFTFTKPGLTVGGGFSYRLTDRFYVRGILSYGSVSADDKKTPRFFFET